MYNFWGPFAWKSILTTNYHTFFFLLQIFIQSLLCKLCFLSIWESKFGLNNLRSAPLFEPRAAPPILTLRSAVPGNCSPSDSSFSCSLRLLSLASLQRSFWTDGLRRHFRARHFLRCTVSGQGTPPNWGSIWIVRVRIMWPFPHDLLHSDHWDHSLSSQSMAGKTQTGVKQNSPVYPFDHLSCAAN